MRYINPRFTYLFTNFRRFKTNATSMLRESDVIV